VGAMVTRRRVLAGLGGLPAGPLLAQVAAAQGQAAGAPARIGLVIPRGGPAAEQTRLGAESGLREGQTFTEFFGKKLELLVEEADAPADAARKATDLARKGRALAVVGGVDDGAAAALRDVAAREPVVVLNVGGRADELRNAACHRRLFHVQASDAMYYDALVQWLAAQRKAKRFGIVASGAPAGAGLRAAAAAAVAAAGGEVVAEAAGRDREALARAAQGADAVLLALPSADQLEVVRAAKQAGVAAPLAGPGLEPGEFLSPDLVGASGVWSALWYHETTRFSARELNRRFREEAKRPMQGTAWAAWAAVRLLAEAGVRAEGAGADAWGRFLESDYPFDGHKGEQLTFRPWDHQVRTTFVIVSPRPASKFKEAPDVYETLSDNQPRDLDAVGTREAATRCRFGS
jgi:ABC transporter substrate binding protein (PQQ-dependent alcohol dehydrogenase system)